MLFLFAAVAMAVMVFAHTAPFPFLLDGLASGTAVWQMPSQPDRPAIYLTFDDGPNPTATPALLDVLADLDARATFFLIPRHLNDETAPIVQRILDEGHAIGVHSHTTGLIWQSPDALVETVTASAALIEELGGAPPCRAFRPHGGWRSGQMFEGLMRIDYVLVGWGWGLWDWNWFQAREPEGLARRLAGKASDGDIIIIHDGHHEDPRADRRYAVDATALLVPALRERGFTLGTIC
ncbi:MAG: polysaccharide deacetylase family protein [Vicinamibacterales bacterium]|nr:polysaccharide deacetylase family protein [Vicinamibacterales bacterium]